MVVSPRRAISPSSVFRPLQNIYSPSCRWKDNSPLVHRQSVTKKEWISPLMSQRIKERGTYTRTEVYINRSPGGENVRTHTGYPLHLLSISFRIWATYSNFGIGGSVAGTTPVQHSPLLSFFFQDQDTPGQFPSGRSYLTDDPSIISGYIITLKKNDDIV